MGIAGLVLICFGLRPHRSSHVHVYHAQGQATLDGKPIANASIWLDPVWTKEPGFPRPHAISQADGSFVLETYDKEDGAPEGEYKVSVQACAKGHSGSTDPHKPVT